MASSKPSRIKSSDTSSAIDSTISMASFVPATVRFKLLPSCSLTVGFTTSLPSIWPILAAATGPSKGVPANIKAVDAAIIAITSGSF